MSKETLQDQLESLFKFLELALADLAKKDLESVKVDIIQARGRARNIQTVLDESLEEED